MSGHQVTVALFAYNQERFVEAALDGVFAQNFRPFRLVVCDDASTDATRARIEDKLRSCPADIEVVRAFAETNLGIGGIINHASAHFVGRTTVFMAGDDVSEPDRVRAAHQAIGAGCGFHYSAVRKTDAAGVFVEEAGMRQDMECTVSDFVSGKMPPVVGASCSYSRDVFSFFGPIDEGLMQEDIILPLRGMLLTRARFDGRALVRYRTHDSNLFSPSHRQSSSEMARRILRFAPSRAAFCRQLRRDLALVQLAQSSVQPAPSAWLRAESDYSELETDVLAAGSWFGRAGLLGRRLLTGRASFQHVLKLSLLTLAPFLYGPTLRIWSAIRKSR